MSNMLEQLLRLLGKNKLDPQVQKFIKERNGQLPKLGELGDDDVEIYEYFKDSIINFYDYGIEFSFDQEKNILTTIHLHGGVSDKRFKKYKDALPLGINFANTRKQINKKLGLPHVSNEKNVQYKWDGYVKGNSAIHILYDVHSEKILQIALMRIDLLSEDLQKIWKNE